MRDVRRTSHDSHMSVENALYNVAAPHISSSMSKPNHHQYEVCMSDTAKRDATLSQSMEIILCKINLLSVLLHITTKIMTLKINSLPIILNFSH